MKKATRYTKPLEICSQLYIGDYFADTLQFSAAEHAIFRQVLLHMWLNEQTIKQNSFAKVSGLRARQWRAMAPTLLPLLTIASSNISKWKAALRPYDGMRLPPREWYIVRTIVLERDSYTCQYCGSSKPLHVDHIIPLTRGGSHAFENLATSCGPCNQSKGPKLLESWKPLTYISVEDEG